MCYCNGTKVGTYENQVTLKVPKNITIKSNSLEQEEKHTLAVDKCLSKEITYLWSQGIRTTGCCCGHNEQLSYIGVVEEDIDKMIKLGYTVQTNPNGMENIDRKDSFYSNSLANTPEMYERHIKHLIKTCIKQ